MRGVMAAVVALVVLAGVAGAAYAADDNFPHDFWKHQERALP